MAASEWAAGRTIGGLIRRAWEQMAHAGLAGVLTAAGRRVSIWFEDGGLARIDSSGAWADEPTPDAERFVDAYEREWHPDRTEHALEI